jgi:hypothetical protein
MGFLAGDFVPQTIFNGVSPETAKMKANLNRILTIGRVRVDIFTVPAGACRDSKVIQRI